MAATLSYYINVTRALVCVNNFLCMYRKSIQMFVTSQCKQDNKVKSDRIQYAFVKPTVVYE